MLGLYFKVAHSEQKRQIAGLNDDLLIVSLNIMTVTDLLLNTELMVQTCSSLLFMITKCPPKETQLSRLSSAQSVLGKEIALPTMKLPVCGTC